MKNDNTIYDLHDVLFQEKNTTDTWLKLNISYKQRLHHRT